MENNKNRMFIYVPVKSKLTSISGWETAYQDNIIFIEDTKEIWAKGTFYTAGQEFVELKNKVDNLKYFSQIQVGDSSILGTPIPGGILKFNSSSGINVSANADGITIKFDSSVIATGTDNGTISVNGTNVAVKGLGTAAYKAESDFATPANVSAAKSEAIAEANKKIASITGTGAIDASTDESKATTVSLKLDNSGNVQFDETSTGLKGTVEIPAATVTGVSSTDKVLSLNGTELTSTINITYDSSAKEIKLIGKNSSVIGSIDATEFIKDGMISDVSLNTDNKLIITWNTDAGKTPTTIDLSKYIDAYDGSNLKLNTITVPETYTQPKAEDNVDTAVGNLIKGISNADAKAQAAQNAVDAIDTGVTSIGGKKGALTLKDSSTNKTVGLKISDSSEISATLNLDTTTWDAALQNVEVSNTSNGSDDTVKLGLTTKTSNKQTLSLTVKTQDVATADATNNGLAMAKDVKDYVDDRLSWLVIQ